MRILHVAHQQLRKYGQTRVSWAQKLYFGLVKNDYLVRGFSDRDVAAFEAPLGIRELGARAANRRLLETAEAFAPELVIVGHCDIIRNETLEQLRALLPGVVIAGANNDPLFVPENAAKIEHRCAVVDAMFVSTGERELAQFTGQRARLLHMPNPVDAAIESADCSQRSDQRHDLIFCSKSEEYTERGVTVRYLRDNLEDTIDFYTPGSFGTPGVWGRDYDEALADSRMGLNLNRQEGLHWYSSARMAQMGGNGLLVFTHADAGFDEMFPPETLAYFSSPEQLLEQVRCFAADDPLRRHWAARTRRFFHDQVNSRLYARYIVEASLQRPYSHGYVWCRG
ncbi:glycosyltransferase family 1 protein [Mangrovimicrobium sediminis]|uniref:Glycosyltransferase family 1 protein n=1 Tax=Mangrovimicrobium sediminis TaxID=2562682 RepID=A0A4Z0LUM0_9GAMM|nr:glycosyltransferase [Haliea sp. SAOS-164]TGD70907.1 glycosyltransferase family 1 protein [Haliea sp. SAOS-164]